MKKLLTLSQLAIQAERSPGFICDIIYGWRRPSIETAKKLAEVTRTRMIVWLDHEQYLGKNPYFKAQRERRPRKKS